MNNDSLAYITFFHALFDQTLWLRYHMDDTLDSYQTETTLELSLCHRFIVRAAPF